MTISVSPATVAQGDTATVEVFWGNNAYGATLILTLSGAASGSQSIPIPEGANELAGTLAIPAGFPDGTIRIDASIAAINASIRDSLIVRDFKPPVIASAFVASALPLPPMAMTNTAGFSDIDFVAGTTDTAAFVATDNHGLAWVGWSFDAPYGIRDSVAVDGLTTNAAVPMNIPISFNGTLPVLSVFARDSDGNLATTSFGQTSVGQYLNHPVRTLPFTTAVSDFAFDAKRQMLYLLEPDSMRVAVLSLATMTFQQPITVPHSPAGLDITPSQDSLFVVLDSTNVITVINLAVSGHPRTLVYLPRLFDSTGTSDTVSIGWRIRIAADNRALIVMRAPDLGAAALLELNLATASQRVIVPAAAFGFNVALNFRSPDARTVVLPTMPLPGASFGLTAYSADSHTYSSGPQIGGAYDDQLLSSLSNAPSAYLGVEEAYDAAFRPLGHIGLRAGWDGVIAPNGVDAYVADSPCPLIPACIDTAQGLIIHQKIPPGSYGILSELVDVSDAPEPPLRLLISPDGNTLIGIGAHKIMAFDLTQSVPATGSWRRHTPLIATHSHTAVRARAVVAAIHEGPTGARASRSLTISGVQMRGFAERHRP